MSVKIVVYSVASLAIVNVYFLKPHDSINDTLTAELLTRFEGEGDFIEIGSGDGIFT